MVTLSINKSERIFLSFLRISNFSLEIVIASFAEIIRFIIAVIHEHKFFIPNYDIFYKSYVFLIATASIIISLNIELSNFKIPGEYNPILEII